LRLDAFEMRTYESLKAAVKPETPLPASDAGCKPQKEERPVVNKITWQKAGRVTEPGRYMFTFGWLTVTAEDIAVWERFPNAAFTLIKTVPAAPATDASEEPGEEPGEEFRLGSFEPGDNLSRSEK
jgi:hypothetical protein